MPSKRVSMLFDNFPADYPVNLSRDYLRILNKLMRLWDTSRFDEYMSELLVSSRENRIGFKPEVVAELLFINRLHDACIARGIKLPVEVSWQNLPQNIASAEALETLIRKAPLEKICACFDKNISVNFRFKNASTPLIVAAEEGRFDVAKFLVDSGAGVNAQSDLHYTALHWAAFYGHRQIVELLLKNGANVNIKDKTGSTPLVLSLVNGHRHIAATMLSSGNHVDKSKLIDIAKKQGMADIVKMLKNQPDYAAP